VNDTYCFISRQLQRSLVRMDLRTSPHFLPATGAWRRLPQGICHTLHYGITRTNKPGMSAAFCGHETGVVRVRETPAAFCHHTPSLARNAHSGSTKEHRTVCVASVVMTAAAFVPTR